MNSALDQQLAEQRTRAVLGVLFLIALAAGQLLMSLGADQLIPGLVLSAVGVGLLVWTRVGRIPAWLSALLGRHTTSARTILILAALAACATATVLDVQYELLDRTNYMLVFLLWIGSGGLWLAAFMVDQPFNVRAWLKAHRQELIIIGLLTAAGAAVRFYNLGQIPRVINGDEGLIGVYATTTNRNPLANPFSLADNFGGLYIQAISLSVQVFGTTPFALRLMPAIGGSLAIPALYVLGRYLFGRRVALLAAVLLIVSHTHMHFSRTVAVAYIQDTWLMPVVLCLFISGLERRDLRRMVLGGIFLAVQNSVYVSAQIVAALLLVYVLIVALFKRSFLRGAGRPILVFALSALLVAAPQIVYNSRHIDLYMARLNADGTFQSGWLANQMAATGQSAVQVLADRVAHAFLSLIYYPADEFYGSRLPVLSDLTAIFFMLGAAYAIWRTRDRHHLLLNGYFWSGTLAIGIFSIPPGADSYRMLMVLPAAILLAALGIDLMLTVLALAVPERRMARLSVMVSLLIVAATLNLQSYFLDFAGQCRYGGGFGTRFASYLGNYQRTLKRETTLILLSNPDLRYGTHRSVDFLGGNIPIVNLDEPLSTQRPEAETVVVAIPDRITELREWTRDHPGGNLHYEYDCGKVMLAAYTMP